MRLFLLIIAMVYAGYILVSAFNRRRRKKAKIRAEFEAQIQDPLFEENEETRFLEQPTTNEKAKVQAQNEAYESPHIIPQEFIILTIRPLDGQSISGDYLHALLISHRYHYGKQKLYHRHIDNDPQKSILFSVASMTEPGFFNLDTMRATQYKGIVIFMGLPSPMDALYTFEHMMISAKALAHSLKAEIYDEKRQILTQQTIEHFRDKIVDMIEDPIAEDL